MAQAHLCGRSASFDSMAVIQFEHDLLQDGLEFTLDAGLLHLIAGAPEPGDMDSGETVALGAHMQAEKPHIFLIRSRALRREDGSHGLGVRCIFNPMFECTRGNGGQFLRSGYKRMRCNNPVGRAF